MGTQSPERVAARKEMNERRSIPYRPSRTPAIAGWRVLRPFLVMLILLAAIHGVLAQREPETAGSRHARLYTIASDSLFTMNRNDAIAGLRSWFNRAGKERGFVFDSKVDTIDNVAEIKRRLEEGTVDLLVLDFLDYLRLEDTHLVVPELVGVRRAGAEPRVPFLLLAAQNSAVSTITDLRGKKLISYSRSRSDTGLAWTEVELARAKLGRAATFFGSIRPVPKAQECVLPLFFGVVDACVVDEVDFEILKEMNPQLGKLRVLARSTPVIEGLVALPAQATPNRQEVMDILMELDHTVAGRQLLTVFKQVRLKQVSPDDIQATRALWTEYRRVSGSLNAPMRDILRSGNAGPAPQKPGPLMGF